MPGGRVLVVDDDPGCRELYAVWLSDGFDVETVDTGRAGLDRIGWPDVVVLDRQLPGVGGTTVAAGIEDAASDPFVVMVSGVEPDVDIVDLPVDAYLTKPVRAEELRDTVETMLSRSGSEAVLRELFALRARKEVIEERRRSSDLADDEQYRALLEAIEDRRATLRERLDQFEPERREEIREALVEVDSGTDAEREPGRLS